MKVLVSLLILMIAPAVRACETALLLAIDVSNSVDSVEYRLQTHGLADALLDPDVMDALVSGQSALAVVQWSSADRQHLSLNWQMMRSETDVRLFSETARALPRAFTLSGTAPAEALTFSIEQFRTAPDCDARVIDMSGDGTANDGTDPRRVIRQAERAGITINGIAIEGIGRAITTYYQRAIITRDGFVITAQRHRDYPRAIREKLIRELAQVFG